MDDLQLTAEQESELLSHINVRDCGTIVRCADAPSTRSMLTVERYIGQRICAVRKRIDQLDQVTIWWRK